MPYTFTAAVDGATLHVRVTPNKIQKVPLIDERPHKHFFIEFHYIYKGEEILFFPTENRRIALSEGTLVMIPRELSHCSETEENTSVTRLCFNFSMEAEEGNETPLFRIFQESKTPQVFQSSFIRDKLDRFQKMLEEESDPIWETREGVFLLDLILEIFRGNNPEIRMKKKSSQKGLRQKWIIEEHIWTRYHAPEGLEGLAQKLYLSQRQTRKLVQRFFGEDYKTLIVRQRMEMAQILIQSGTLSIEEVAEKVGYRSYSGFHLAFVRTFGVTPGEYRNAKAN